ncbi:MAG: hypothetical protein LQ344_003244 [Seirophora lacunosa]|nr:MAG: hypothetical protein LQ344_003244 [Seirophora lacunosa]
MPKDKSRALNPATAHLKSEKARSIRKSRAAVSSQRTERLASRNPSRLERQIADLKQSISGDGDGLKGRDKKQLEELERQLGAVRRAREKVGGRVTGGEGGGGGGRGGGASVLGKRGRGKEEGGYERRRARREEEEEGLSAASEETDESVRAIPMPRDTPPPVPFPRRHHTSSSAQRRHQQDGSRADHHAGRTGDNANLEPLGEGRVVHALPQKPPEAGVRAAAKTTYEAKPVVRDLRKEAVRAFMPAVVARKVGAARGEGGAGGRLLEEEEVEKLEREGYTVGGGGQEWKSREGREGARGEGEGVGTVDAAPVVVEMEKGKTGVGDEQQRRLQEEEERFSREVRMEEVTDEDM